MQSAMEEPAGTQPRGGPHHCPPTIAAVSDVGGQLRPNDRVSLGHLDASMLTTAPTALPSVLARVLAFGAIVIAAVCGGFAGYATGTLQCSQSCTGTSLAGTAIGALVASVGVAALAALVLRSMSEWVDQASVWGRHPNHAPSEPTNDGK